MSKLHSMAVIVKVFSDDQEIRAEMEREYKLESPSRIPEIFDHAGRSAALYLEGIDELDMKPSE